MLHLLFGLLLTLSVLLPPLGQFAVAGGLPVNAGMVLADSRQADIYSPVFAQAWLNAVARYTGKTEAQLSRMTGIAPVNRVKVIERYQFESVPAAFRSGELPQYWLHVFVNKLALRALAEDNDLPVWLEERERVIVWLLDQTGDMPRMAGMEQDASAYWLYKRAEQAGLSFDFAGSRHPEDSALDISDLQHFSSTIVDKARSIIDGSAVMLLRVTPVSRPSGAEKAENDSDKVVTGPVKWEMLFSGESGHVLQKQGVASSVDGVAQSVVALVRQWQTARERIYPQERRDHTIWMDMVGLNDFADVQAVINTLDRLSVVSDHVIRKAQPGRLQLAVRLNVTTDAFVRYLTRAGRYRVVQHTPLVVEKY